ncbi:MAG: copper resistance system multicopper oxidase [Phenylobacterium sp.]
MSPDLNRRALLGAAASLAAITPAWARSASPGATGSGADVLSGEDITLVIGWTEVVVAGRRTRAVTVNGRFPAPLIRLREGQDVRLRLVNTLDEDTSIHWHGLLLPWTMDGVPGISFPGVPPGETFTAAFRVRQAGTYWYHGHSNMQEALGLFGPLVIDPAGPEAAPYDREHVLMLSDWSFTHPHEVFRKLKQRPDYYNPARPTLSGLLAGKPPSGADRRMWSAMRMDPADIADVAAPGWRQLVNGCDTAANWTGLFTPGERVRLRIINASAMTNFNFRIPGLPMTVVQADGQDVEPVETDEFQVAIAETYDVIVRPGGDQAYALVAEALDRSGLARATLAPRPGLAAPVPDLRPRPILTLRDMGMPDHGPGGMDHSAHGPPPGEPRNPGSTGAAPSAADRTGDRPTGLEKVPHRVLTYRQLKSLKAEPAPRRPERRLDIHLTGNMERYMWSFDGVKMSERPEPLVFRQDERVRVRLINDTMMPHPIHLHGHFFELVTGQPGRHPRKHTVNVLPGGVVTFDLTADEPGDWAFHCHMMMHMHAGMFRKVSVRPGAAP